MLTLKQIRDFLKVDAKREARFWDTPDDDAGQSVPALPWPVLFMWNSLLGERSKAFTLGSATRNVKECPNRMRCCCDGPCTY